jgi:hypothetical protein
MSLKQKKNKKQARKSNKLTTTRGKRGKSRSRLRHGKGKSIKPR